MISALVVNHDGAAWIERCLASLGDPPPDDVEVVVVDNASSDGSPELVRQRFPHVRLLAMAHNVGFAVANNLAAGCARGDALLLLNNDAWLEPGCLARLREKLERDPRIGLVAPRLIGPDRRPRFSWAPDRSLLGEAVQRLRNPYQGRWWNHGPVDRVLRLLLGPGWYTAACLLIRRRAFDQVGGFDPAYFLYFEDVDLCLRLRRHGWRLARQPRAVAVHAGGGRPLDQATELHYRQSQLYYYSRHRPRREEQALWNRLVERYPEGPVAEWLRVGNLPDRTAGLVDGAAAELAEPHHLPAAVAGRLGRYLNDARTGRGSGPTAGGEADG
jgi:GT2 family glycosyltransferase